MFVCDELVDTEMEKDPANVWNSLKEIYQSGDLSQIMLINSQFLHYGHMKKEMSKNM